MIARLVPSDMLRTFTAVLGVLVALFPDKAVDGFEAGFIENPGECRRKPLGRLGIRAEGIVVLAASLAGGRAYAWLMDVTGIAGSILLVVPRAYRTVANAMLYEEPDRVEWNERFAAVVRLIGLVYVLLAVRAFRTRRAND